MNAELIFHAMAEGIVQELIQHEAEGFSKPSRGLNESPLFPNSSDIQLFWATVS